MNNALRDPWTVRFMKWLGQYVVGLTWVWQHILYPVWRMFFRIYKFLSGLYMSLWFKVTKKDGRFSRKRAGLMIVATCTFIYCIGGVLHFGYQVGMFAMTAKNESVILTSSQEIDPDNDVHSIKGCLTLPCTDDNSVYYRIRPTAFHHLHSLMTNGKLFYPDRIAAIVANGYNKCEISPAYGFRQKLFVRKMQIYPDILNVVCEPLGVQQ